MRQNAMPILMNSRMLCLCVEYCIRYQNRTEIPILGPTSPASSYQQPPTVSCHDFCLVGGRRESQLKCPRAGLELICVPVCDMIKAPCDTGGMKGSEVNFTARCGMMWDDVPCVNN